MPGGRTPDPFQNVTEFYSLGDPATHDVTAYAHNVTNARGCTSLPSAGPGYYQYATSFNDNCTGAASAPLSWNGTGFLEIELVEFTNRCI